MNCPSNTVLCREGRNVVVAGDPAATRAVTCAISALAALEDATIFLVGSQTTGEANGGSGADGWRSDVDLLIVFDQIPTPSLAGDVRSVIATRPCACEATTAIRIGTRLRGLSELETFVMRMCSWGYSCERDARWLAGRERKIPTALKTPGPGWVINNWLERLWLNLLRCLARSRSATFVPTMMLDILTLELLRRGRVPTRHRERISLLAEQDAPPELSRYRWLFEKCLDVKLGLRSQLDPADEQLGWMVFWGLCGAAFGSLREAPLHDLLHASFGSYALAVEAQRGKVGQNRLELRLRRVVELHAGFLVPMNRALLFNRREHAEVWLARARRGLRELYDGVGADFVEAPGTAQDLLRRYAVLRLAYEPLTARDHSWYLCDTLQIDPTSIPNARAIAVEE